MVLKIGMHQSHSGGLLKHRYGPDSVGLGHVLRIYISSQFPGDAYAAGLGHILETNYHTSPNTQSGLMSLKFPTLFTSDTTMSLGFQQKTVYMASYFS